MTRGAKFRYRVVLGAVVACVLVAGSQPAAQEILTNELVIKLIALLLGSIRAVRGPGPAGSAVASGSPASRAAPL